MEIAIVGGGITGLCTALALKKEGHSVQIFEKEETLKPVGAGIWLQPNALRVLDWLGLKEEVKRKGIELRRMEITDMMLRPYKAIKEKVVQDEEGNQTVAIHRARLQSLLVAALGSSIPFQTSNGYVSHKQTNSKILVKMSLGEAVCDVLLGADGIHSSLRRNLFPKATLRSANQMCWRGVAEMELPTEYQSIGKEAWGKNLRFGFSPIGPKEVYWFAVACGSQMPRLEPDLLKSMLLQKFSLFNPLISKILEASPAHKIHQSLLQDLKRLPKWHSERVCIIGDAAHATTPNMGQGACQGIEDAYFISQCLGLHEKNPLEAFQDFENMRRKKVDYVVNTSWRFGKLAHHRLGKKMLICAIKATPEPLLSKQLYKLYSLKPW